MADLSPAVNQAIEKISGGRREHLSRLRRYDHAYDVYRATAPKARASDPWQSQLRVPYGKQVIDTALVNMVSGRPRIMVKARHEENEMGAKAMQVALDYYVAEDHLVEKQPVFVQQGLIYGVTVAKNHWLYRKTSRPTRTFSHNPMDPTVPIEKVDLAEVIVRDGPTFDPINVYHTYWEPGATDVDSAGYFVLQFWYSADDLRRLAFDPATGEGIYHNVEQLIAAGPAEQPAPSAQNRATGFHEERYKGKFLVEEIWTDDELVVLGNKHVLMRQQQNPYWHGKKPIVVAQTNPDMFEMVGASETEMIDHLQQALWTVQNMRVDNLHMTVMRGITYREGGVTDPNMLELRPRFKWAVSDHDDIRPFEVQPLPPEAYGEENALLARLQLVTGINPYVSGSDLQSVDQNTATGVTALQEVASRLLRFKAAQIQMAYQRSFEMWGDMVQQFLDDKIAVKIMGAGNQGEWAKVGAADVAGHFNYHLEGSEESLSKQQERGEAIGLLNATAPLAQLGIINFPPILERVAVSFNFPNPESLILPSQPPPQAAPGPQDPLYNVRSPQIGQVPQRQNIQAAGLQMDPQLARALGTIGSGATNG